MNERYPTLARKRSGLLRRLPSDGEKEIVRLTTWREAMGDQREP